MPRLFSAIEIPADVAKRLAGLRGGLAGARWIDPEDYHITLRFIGDVDGATADRFDEALGKIRSPAFDLVMDCVGSFGGRKPRTVWAGVAANGALAALSRANELAAQKAGLEPEGRNFHPHITLARLRGAKSDNVARYLSERGAFLTQPFTVRRFVLYSSRASKGGGPYVVERAYPLGEAGDEGS
jgi:2'-5' RNA ligase